MLPDSLLVAVDLPDETTHYLVDGQIPSPNISEDAECRAY